MKRLLLCIVFSIAAFSADPDRTTQTLEKACRLGDLKSAESLLSAGVDPNLSNQYGRTPLYYAALFNHDDIAALLLAHHADPNTRARGETRGLEFPQTPLQVAAAMGNPRIASMLIEAGADIDGTSQKGRTALHFAVVTEHLDVVRLLIEKGADISIRDADGTAPLDDAVWRGNVDATAILLANGARLDEPETKTGATPINEAAYRGQTQIVEYLLRRRPDLKLADSHGYSPIENATRMGNADAAVLLLEAQTSEERTPQLCAKIMGAAIKHDEAAVFEALLRGGADANTLLPSGVTPLDAAASSGASNVVRVLVNRGADPNQIGSNGASPLEDACLRGFAAIAEMLLDHGALINQVNSASGATALYAAASFGKSDVVRLLLQRDADPGICGNGHVTPYTSALNNGYGEVAIDIQRHGGSKACNVR